MNRCQARTSDDRACTAPFRERRTLGGVVVVRLCGTHTNLHDELQHEPSVASRILRGRLVLVQRRAAAER